MKTIVIKHKDQQKTLYSGQFADMKAALENAITDGILLTGADLSGAILSHANLDGADFSSAIFDGCDLTGANLSECNCEDASFVGTDLSLAALCESRLIGCDFTNASFGGTLLDGAIIDGCLFTCPTALSLPFSGAAQIGHNRFGLYHFRAAPVVVTGLPKRIVFLDDVVLLGDDAWPRADMPNPFERLFVSPKRAVDLV